MMKKLQEKAFKMNLDVPYENSIIMKRRERDANGQDIAPLKFIDNQLFDTEGNVLGSTINQSILGSLNSKLYSEFTQSVGNVPAVKAGP